MPRFSYIHISDTHLCLQHSRRNATGLFDRDLRGLIDTGFRQPRRLGFRSLAMPASYEPTIVLGVAQFCLARSAVTDAILITGDIATTGIDVDLAVAANFVTAPVSATVGGYVSDFNFPTLRAAGIETHVLPGNHDRYSDNAATPNNRAFNKIFGSLMKNLDGEVGYWIDPKLGCNVAFVYADFSLRHRIDALDGAVGLYGQGRVYPTILESLKQKTRDLQQENNLSCTIWVMHFAPFDCGYRLQLIDYLALRDAAEELGVKAILCGHTHKVDKIPDGGLTIYCSGSAGCVDSENDAYVHVINIDVSGTRCSVWRENYLWDAGRTQFQFTHRD